MNNKEKTIDMIVSKLDQRTQEIIAEYDCCNYEEQQSIDNGREEETELNNWLPNSATLFENQPITNLKSNQNGNE